MVKIRTQQDIILGLLDFFRVAQPNMDTKPGTVARDLVIDSVGTQVARLYEELARVSSNQSLRLAVGSDLDKLAANFGVVRKRGSKSSGTALLTFNSLDADVNINQGSIISAKNGATFIVTAGVTVSSVYANSYKAVAAQFRADLEFIGITDQYAVEVLVESTSTGVQGNISKYSLNYTNIPGVSNVTNTSPFSGGTQAEEDASFRSRILGIFSGANTGTELGYKNAALSNDAVLDALVIVPGDTLMTRDGTQVGTDSSGNKVILSEGSGGKVDIYILGAVIQEVIDGFVFRDKSNTGDPTNSLNNFVLGQISGDENKTVTRKRLDNLASKTLPQQPVNNIIRVSGSLSGPNFIEKSVDSLGRVSGNYELLKDTGEFAGSPWGYDALHFISNKISGFIDDTTKGIFNGQDPLSFSDVLEISGVQQKINVTNENSKVVPTNRSRIQLGHYPVTNVTRVFNVTTGERYVITNQNPDGSGSVNNTGYITISGNSLPSVSDILQADYTWLLNYDQYFDFDNKLSNRNLRSSGDNLDWGFSNNVRREQATLISAGSYLSITTAHPISSVISVNVFTSNTSSIDLVSGKLAVVVSDKVSNVISVVDNISGAELYNTSANDGSFNAYTIFLPTDTVATYGNAVTVYYNAIDVFNADGYNGSYSGSTISIVPSSSAVAGSLVEVNYIANINTILPATTLSNLPAIRNSNAFKLANSVVVGCQPTTHIFSGAGVVVSNLRMAPSRLALTISGNVSPGIITVSGMTIHLAEDIVYTVGTAGLKQDLTSAIRKAISEQTNQNIPTNLKLVRIDKVERVDTVSSLNDDVLDVLHTYDVKGYGLKFTLIKDESIYDSTLEYTEFTLPSTPDNLSNVPQVGHRIRISFHYILDNDSDSVAFSRSGTLYTNKPFVLADSISISSGFTSGTSLNAVLTITNMNQPGTGARYKATYDYLAPKQNERITITYNNNKLIADTTLNVESVRPINADVLVKSATAILVDVTMNIVVTDEFKNNKTTVVQNVKDAVTASLNARQLGTIIDSSDLVNVAYTIQGVDRVRIMYFNKTGEFGSVLSISAEKNEFIVANVISINTEER